MKRIPLMLIDDDPQLKRYHEQIDSILVKEYNERMSFVKRQETVIKEDIEKKANLVNEEIVSLLKKKGKLPSNIKSPCLHVEDGVLYWHEGCTCGGGFHLTPNVSPFHQLIMSAFRFPAL